MTNVRLLKKYYKRYLSIKKKYRYRSSNSGLCRFNKFRYDCDICPHERFLKKEDKKIVKLINRVIGYHEGYWYMNEIFYTIDQIRLRKKKGIKSWNRHIVHTVRPNGWL